MDPQLIDQIYECAFVPELWPDVLNELASVAGARTGFFFTSNQEVHNWAGSNADGSEVFDRLVKSGYIPTTQRHKRLQAACHNGFLTELDLFTIEELQSDPLYRDLLYPRGMGWAAATTIPLPTGDNLTVQFEREFVRGPVEHEAVETLNAFRPHLARSGLMAARLQLERARAAGEALALIGLAAAMFDRAGKVLAANALVETVSDHIRWRSGDRLSLKDKRADQSLRDAIATIGVADGAAVRSFPVRDAQTRAVMVAHVIPIRLSARDLFGRCAAVLVLTPVTLPQAPPVDLVQSLFDLTPAEARVARDLAGGKTVIDIASDGGLSSHTIRAQVRRVLEKTGCSRQVDVIALLTGIVPARLHGPA